jgi:opacity protein-like surface antigen
MKKISLHHTLFLSVIAILLLSSTAEAQRQRQRGSMRNSKLYRGMSNYGVMKLSLGAGSATYFGDLCETGDCISARPYFNLGFDYRFGGRVRARLEGAYYRLSSTDAGGKNAVRNLSFRSGNIEVVATGVYEFFSYNKFFNQRPLFSPYLFAGIGFTYFTPRAQYEGSWYTLPKYDTEGVNYNQFAPVIPFGVGVQIALAPQWDLALEVGYRKLFTDYLDDVSTVYKDNASFADPRAANLADRTAELNTGVPTYDSNDGDHWNEGHKRGNPDKKDAYIVLAAKLEYTINPLVKTRRSNLKFRRPKFSGGTGSPRRKKRR